MLRAAGIVPEQSVSTIGLELYSVTVGAVYDPVYSVDLTVWSVDNHHVSRESMRPYTLEDTEAASPPI